MFILKPTNQFKKDLRILIKRSIKNEDLITQFLLKLQMNGAEGIEKKHRPHELSGKYADDWEAHIKPDVLIIWFEITQENEIILLRVGSHADLF